MTLLTLFAQRRSSAWILLGIGLSLLMAGFALTPAAWAQTDAEPSPGPQQPTRFASVFDSAPAAGPASPELSPTVQPDATVEPAEPTGEATTETVEAEPTITAPPAQPTRFTSVFDQSSAPAQATTAPPAGDDAASTTPDAQPTRVPSVFDQAGQAPANSGGTAPTRIPSVFDQAGQAPAGGAPTRIPSLFDQAGQAPASGGNAAPTPLVSMFDTASADVIRYEGEEAPPSEYCLGCHESPFLQMSLPSGEVISVAVDAEEYQSSVHGQHGEEGYRCVRCHTGMNEYPHEEISAQTARELVIDLSTSCARCHTDMYDETRNDLHVDVLARGNQNGATCADCHTGHAVQRLTNETTNQPLPGSAADSAAMCAGCHSEIYARYTESVHGQSVATGNNDAATCSDCHGTHNTQGPSTGPFRLFSPQTCATCHADDALMAKYDISTDVFDTYVSDFHGTTVTIFQQTSPDHPLNAPVCTDCHGVHNIMAVESADSPVIKENLVATCQRCHPNASDNFPAAWMSHYQPTFERTPVVAAANLAYMLLIPAVIGGMAFFVATDVHRRRSKRAKDRK